MILPRLLLLTDRSQLPLGRSLLRTVAECAAAGVTHVVLRELDLPRDHRAALAAELSSLGVTVIAAHDPLPGAAGVQVPAGGGVPDGLTGRSCHSRAEVVSAAAEGADYATLSPYAATDSKPGYGPLLAADAFDSLPLPTYALGGITPANAADAIRAGACGVAVMGAVMRAEAPAEVARALLQAVEPAEVGR